MISIFVKYLKILFFNFAFSIKPISKSFENEKPGVTELYVIFFI